MNNYTALDLNLPARISRLGELAYNLWWSWQPDASSLFQTLDKALWELTQHNPVKLLRQISAAKLEAAATDPAFLRRYDGVMKAFDRCLHAGGMWFTEKYPHLAGRPIAYFSAEFGVHNSLPIYSGGLGILAGDHCKEASDLGLPLVGVGFIYPQGYFRQHITREGVQEAFYDKLHFSAAPAVPAYDPDGNEVIISVDLPGRKIHAKVWKIQVGRVPLYLMDTDVEPNAPADREL